MNRTRSKLSEYWDNLIAERIPSYIHLNKVEGRNKRALYFSKMDF